MPPAPPPSIGYLIAHDLTGVSSSRRACGRSSAATFQAIGLPDTTPFPAFIMSWGAVRMCRIGAMIDRPALGGERGVTCFLRNPPAEAVRRGSHWSKQTIRSRAEAESIAGKSRACAARQLPLATISLQIATVIRRAALPTSAYFLFAGAELAEHELSRRDIRSIK